MRDCLVQVHEEMEEKPKNCLNQTRSCNVGWVKMSSFLRVRKPDHKDVKRFSLGHTVNDKCKIRVLGTPSSGVELYSLGKRKNQPLSKG